MMILLADDDRFIRFSIKSILLDFVDEDCVILEAKNGKELIEKCISYQPNLVFADINMPYLDGISAIEQCQHLTPLTQFAIISAYSDFTYAQKCVSLNISDYILKPIDPQQLKECYEKLLKKYNQASVINNSQFQTHLMNVYNLFDEIGFDPSLAPTISNANILYGFTLFIDCINDSAVYTQLYNKLLNMFNQIGIESMKHHVNHASLNSKEGSLRVVFAVPSLKVGEWLIHEINHKFIKNAGLHHHISGFYTIQSNLSDLYLASSKMQKARALRFHFSLGNIHDFSKTFELSENQMNFYKLVQDLLDAYLQIDEHKFLDLFNDLKKYKKHNESFIQLSSIISYLQIFTDKKIECQRFSQVIDLFNDLLQKMHSYMPSNNKNGRIDKIKKFIDLNYMNDITINSIAEQFELTPNYLSKLFHDQTQRKFIDYLAEVRISNAKRILLQNRDTPIKEVALMVGYYNPRYFTNVFVKINNCYPSEFRKNNKNGLEQNLF